MTPAELDLSETLLSLAYIACVGVSMVRIGQHRWVAAGRLWEMAAAFEFVRMVLNIQDIPNDGRAWAVMSLFQVSIAAGTAVFCHTRPAALERIAGPRDDRS